MTKDDTELDKPEEPRPLETTSEGPFIGRTVEVTLVYRVEVVQPQDVIDPPKGGLNIIVSPFPVPPTPLTEVELEVMTQCTYVERGLTMH